MIQKITAAAKNMAQRAMMRGNIGEAETISNLGANAAKNILRNNAKPLSSNTKNSSAGIHSVVVEENVRDLKKDLQTGGHTQGQTNKSLGGNILDALK